MPARSLSRPSLAMAFPRSSTPTSQFTAEEFTHAVLSRRVRLSMDGKGAWCDNVFVERLWRTIKYERVYLRSYDGVSADRRRGQLCTCSTRPLSLYLLG